MARTNTPPPPGVIRTGKRGKPKGYPKTGGRKKGTPNKITKDVREVVRAAFDTLGGHDYLVSVGKRDPKVFMTAFNKLIPTAVEANVNVSHEDALRALGDDES